MTYWFYDLAKFVLWLLFRLGFGLEVRGHEHIPTHGAFVLASNHTSYLDPPVLGAACPRRLGFMARADLFQHLFLGTLLRGLHVIPLQRGEHDLGAIREAVRRLHRGEAVAIFPEGGRQASGRLGSAKRGVGLLAAAAEVPVIPTLVTGTFEALPPHARALRRAKIRVAFGPAIAYTDASASPVGSGTSAVTLALPTRSHHERLADAVTRQWHALAAQRSSRQQP